MVTTPIEKDMVPTYKPAFLPRKGEQRADMGSKKIDGRKDATGVADRLTVEKRKGYLYAHFEGEVSREGLAADYLRRITDHCRRTDCRRIIIEKDIPRAFGVWDIFSVATKLPLLGEELTKIAVVDRSARGSDQSKFTVMVGRKSGVDVSVFPTVDEAETWVTAD